MSRKGDDFDVNDEIIQEVRRGQIENIISSLLEEQYIRNIWGANHLGQGGRNLLAHDITLDILRNNPNPSDSDIREHLERGNVDIQITSDSETVRQSPHLNSPGYIHLESLTPPMYDDGMKTPPMYDEGMKTPPPTPAASKAQSTPSAAARQVAPSAAARPVA